jgi:hypothetical protein
MSSLKVALLMLCATSAAYGSILQVTFSGVFGSALGPIHAGDAFSGSGTWDSNTVGAVVSNFAVLTAFNITLPPADGLSVPGTGTLSFAGAHWNGSAFDNLQINDTSSADHATYVFFLNFTSAQTGGAVTNANFTQQSVTTSYQLLGPTVVPEPGTGALTIPAALIALGLIIGRRWKRVLRPSNCRA